MEKLSKERDRQDIFSEQPPSVEKSVRRTAAKVFLSLDKNQTPVTEPKD